MKELDLLKTMWLPKVSRKTDLIVPEMTSSKSGGYLNNEHWKFNVHFAFRDALDIKYEQRIKNKIPYMIWTQGPNLHFKNGDTIHSRNEKKAVQILYSSPIGWDVEKEAMYEGSVVFDEFNYDISSYIKTHQKSYSQMQFLQMLIYDDI